MSEGFPRQERSPLLEALERDHYASFDLDLRAEERESLNTFRIERQNTHFDHFGAADELLKKRISENLAAIGENPSENIERIAALVQRLAEKSLADFNKESAWVTIRATLPDSEFDTPRWHPDGSYFSTKPEESAYKLVAALKGSKTRFAKALDSAKVEELLQKQEKNYGGANDAALDRETRRELDASVTEIHPAGEAVYYLVGSENAVLHSEPPLHEPRLFVSILPGSKEQIEELRARWKR